MKEKMKLREDKGITLIALVITIIVLLILAGVSIASLTGDSGILKKAQTAGEKTKEATAIEKVQIAILGSYNEKGEIDIETFKNNLKQTEGVVGVENITELPATLTVDGYQVKIDKTGKVTIEDEVEPGQNPPTSEEPKEPTTVEEAIQLKKPLSTTENKTILDKYENQVVVPAGFKITEDSAIEVTKGIVIEDVSHESTRGSQFVWIPVGTIYTNETRTQSETIDLNRYTFPKPNGTPVKQDINGIAVNKTYYELCDSTDPEYYASFYELEKSELSNKTALDIEAFKESSTINHGYYIRKI